MFHPVPRAVLIDAGFTLVFPSGARIAEVAAGAGVRAEPDHIERAVAGIYPDLARYAWPSRPASTAPLENGPLFFRTILERAGAEADAAAMAAAGRAVWESHLQRNVWCQPGPGVGDALARLRAAGFALAVVSNSEGTIARLVEELGWSDHFAAVLDSWVEHLVKPEPAFFQRAAERLGVAPRECVMVGDSPAADVEGARAVGMHAALVEPYGIERPTTAPRFPDLPTFVTALLGT